MGRLSVCVTRTNWFDFGEDPDLDTTTRILNDSSPLGATGLKRYVAYLNKLWTDLADIWCVSWLGDEDKPILNSVQVRIQIWHIGGMQEVN